MLRGVAGDADQHAVVGAHVDRIADGPVLDQAFGERSTLQRRMRDQALALAACERARGLDLEITHRGRGFERIRITIGLVHHAPDQVAVGALTRAAGQLDRKLLAHLLERHRVLAAAHLAQLQHVPAEIGPDRIAHLARLHREQRLLELGHHRARLDPVQVAARVGGAKVVGMLAGERGEVRALGLGLARHLARAVLRRLRGRRVRIGRHLDQDVRSQALLVAAEAGALTGVVRAQFLFGRHVLHFDHGGVHLQVFNGHRLRRAEVRLVGVVPGLDLIVPDLARVGFGRRHDRELHVAALAQQHHQALDLRRRHERRLGDLHRDQRLLQALADGGFELARRLRRHLGLQRHLVALQVELSVHLERRELLDLPGHLGIAHRDAAIARRQPQHGLVDQAFKHLAPVLDRLERARIVIVAHLDAGLLPLLFERAAEVLDRNGLRAPCQLAHRPQVRGAAPPRRRGLHPGGVVGATLEQVLLHAEEGERDRQQDHDANRDPAGHLFSKCLQHRVGLAVDVAGHSNRIHPPPGAPPPAGGGAPQKKNPRRSGGFSCLSGGADGTRTRDLRRDRPAF